MNKELYISEFMPPDEGQEQAAARFEIKNDLAADWALDKIRDARADIARIEMVAKEKIRQIEQAVLNKTRDAKGTEEFFVLALKDYFKKVEPKATKTQRKYDLPSGKLIEKDKPWDFKQDKTELLGWAKHTNEADFVKVTEEAKWAEIKKASNVTTGIFVDTETGIIIDKKLAIIPFDDTRNVIVDEEGEILEKAKYIDYPVFIYKDQLVEGVTVIEQDPEFKIEL